MRILTAVFLSLLFLTFPGGSSSASAAGEGVSPLVRVFFPINPFRTYRIYTIVKVTPVTVTLERTDDSGQQEQVEIARSRISSPSIKVGDRIRYDKKRDRLIQTIIKPDGS